MSLKCVDAFCTQIPRFLGGPVRMSGPDAKCYVRALAELVRGQHVFCCSSYHMCISACMQRVCVMYSCWVYDASTHTHTLGPLHLRMMLDWQHLDVLQYVKHCMNDCGLAAAPAPDAPFNQPQASVVLQFGHAETSHTHTHTPRAVPLATHWSCSGTCFGVAPAADHFAQRTSRLHACLAVARVW